MGNFLYLGDDPGQYAVLSYPPTNGPFEVGGSVALSNQKLPTDPVGTSSLTLSNLPVGVEIRIRQGSYTLLHEQDAPADTYVYNYNYYSSPTKVKIQFTLPGYVFEDLEMSLYNVPLVVHVIYNPDPSYI